MNILEYYFFVYIEFSVTFYVYLGLNVCLWNHGSSCDRFGLKYASRRLAILGFQK